MATKPLLHVLTHMAQCVILLKLNRTMHTCHVLVKIQQGPFLRLLTVSFRVHPSPLPTRILQHNQWAIPPLYNASPHHDTHR